MEESEALEDAAWSSAYGIATPQQAALLDADPRGRRVSLERLIAGIDELLSEDQSDSTRSGAAALTARRTQLLGELDRLSSLPTTAIAAGAGDGESTGEAEPPGKAQLHATWDASRLVVWSAGRATAPADFDQLSDFL